MGRPSNPSYGNALAAPVSSSSPQTSYSSSSPTNSLTDDQMLGLVLEMHSMMQVLMQNSQRPPSTQYSATSSNSFSSSPTFASSSSSYASPASSNNAPILPSSQSSFSSSSSSFTPSTSNSSPTSTSFGAASSLDSYGNPLGRPLSNNSPSSSQAPSSSTLAQVQSPPASVSASSSYGSARAPLISSASRAPTISSPSRGPTISSNEFSLPQFQATNDPLVKAASTGTQDQYETELATLDAVIEMLSAYQEEQARRRRRKLSEATNLVEERRGQERLEREEDYKPLRFPEGPSPGRVKAVLALFQNRRMDDLLLHTRSPDSDLINSPLLDAKLSETDFKRMLLSAGIWPESGIRESENEEETTNKRNKEKVEDIPGKRETDEPVSASDLKVEHFF